MFWGDKIAEQIKGQFAEKIRSGGPLVIRDEKTASGRVHVGSLRGVAIHGLVSEVLSEQGIANRYLYEINDFDPMDGLPVYLDRETFLPHMGKPLRDVPSPDGKAANYAEYFAEEFMAVIREAGFEPEFYRSSELYLSGKYNGVIRTALENAGKIREIYRRVSGAVKGEDWLPVQVVCENCGKVGTTRAVAFDGEQVEYVCGEDFVKWAVGCGHRGKVSPFDGRAKLPWKVEWAAKFSVLGVDIEGAGKDHSTKGGSRQIADAISREVFDRQPPFDIPYEFFQVGGKKMSSSKGAGSSSREMADLLPPEMLRLLLIGKDPKRVIDFIPDGDTVPLLYDTYDKFAESFFLGEESDYARIFFLAHTPEQRKGIAKRFLPRFSLVAFLVQMPHMDFESEITKLKGEPLTEADKQEAKYRARYARQWLKLYAPEDYRYELQEGKVPEAALGFSDDRKAALKMLLEYVRSRESLDGQELHTELHEIKKRTGINPRDLFSAVYVAFLGKESGPKAGWFLSVLDKPFLEKRLEEVSSA
jgi:lysyl-tRNA synthetase class 1